MSGYIANTGSTIVFTNKCDCTATVSRTTIITINFEDWTPIWKTGTKLMIFMDLFFQLYFMLARLSKKGLSSESFSLHGLYTISFSVNLEIHEQIPLIVPYRTKKKKRIILFFVINVPNLTANNQVEQFSGVKMVSFLFLSKHNTTTLLANHLHPWEETKGQSLA